MTRVFDAAILGISHQVASDGLIYPTKESALSVLSTRWPPVQPVDISQNTIEADRLQGFWS
jgi:hypothetical protein